uniref:Type IV pilus biogenesis n=1 Tax=mine drainage metagenome TaxID=410659 RepID=E6QGP6_9ZZZZ
MRRTLFSASIIAAFAMGCPLPALAGQADSATPSPGTMSSGEVPTPTTGQIDALNGRIAVLEAQLKIAKLKASIKKEKGGGAAGASAIPFQSAPYYPAPATTSGRVRVMPGAALPRVESITGAGDRLSAMVSLPDGGQRIVTTGSRLPGGLVVRAVTPSGVEVSGKGKDQWLSFVNGPAESVPPPSAGLPSAGPQGPMFAFPAGGSSFGPPAGLPPAGMNQTPPGMPGGE